MRTEQAFKLQAWLDGELPAAEARQIETWAATDAQARLLADRLRAVRALTDAGEPQRRVPESREFYWSTIARGIAQAERQAAQAQPLEVPWWRHWFVPVGGVAALSLVALATLLITGNLGRSAHLALGHEIETPLAEVTSFTFWSESTRMTVVWVDCHQQ